MLSLLRSGECQFKCKGPQKAQGKRKGRACIPRSSPSILGDSDRYLLVRLISITQATNKKLITEISTSITCPIRAEKTTKTCIQSKDSRPNTGLCVQGLQHVWFSISRSRQSAAETTCPSRSYTKIRGTCQTQKSLDFVKANGCFPGTAVYLALPPTAAFLFLHRPLYEKALQSFALRK